MKRHSTSRANNRLAVVFAGAIPLSALQSARAANLAGTVSLIPIDSNAYGVNDLNSVGISRDNLATVGNYQYTAYYSYVSKSTADIVVGRRASNSSTWTLVTTPYSINTAGNGSDSIITSAIDDHDVVAMAVDGSGDMHLSWGMHNIPLNYAISTPVNGSTFNPAFTTQTPTNNPNLFAEFTSTGISQATYPEFYYTPNSQGLPSGNLLFDIRDAASATGGGSGNGNTYISTCNGSAGFSSPIEVLNGGQTSVNGYQNNLVYDHNSNLLLSWTWRGTSNWQTNSNILFAQSSNNGTTWTQQGGSPVYTLPIIANNSSGGSASQVAQVIEPISQNSSLINQAGMTVDANNNPIIATWYTPNGNASQAVSGSNNPNRQYMLVYYTGSQWKISQISNRTTDTAFDTSGNDVRDIGRPLVMVDKQGRVLVVTRSDNAMGTFTNTSASGNNLVVYWNTIASLDSATPAAWQPIAIDTANMGEYEPSMDYNLWNSSNILNLFYEPSGFANQTTGTAQVLQWNEQAYFAVATPASLTWSSTAPALHDGGGIWDNSHQNWAATGAAYAWNNNFSTYATFGVGTGTAGVVTLGANVSAQSITFNAAGSGNYNIAGGGYTLSMPAGAVVTANTNATISAPLSVASSLNKLGAGTLILSGSNSFTSTIVLGSSATTGGNVNGALQVTSATAVAGATLIKFTESGAAYDLFQMNGSMTLPSTLSFSMPGSATVANANVIESLAGNSTINGAISPAVGGNQYTVQTDAGLLTVTSNFNLGTLGTARYLNLGGAGSGNWTGVLGNGTGGGTLGVTKLGTGTWTLNNTETFTGSTNISAGTLVLTSSASLASPVITVAAGATFNAAGSLNSSTALNVSGSALLQPFTAAGVHVRTLASLNVAATGNIAMVDSTNHSSRSVLVTSSLSLAGTTGAWQGKVDLTDNDMVIRNGSIGAITNQVAVGFGAGDWNSSAGIISSVAAADKDHLTAVAAIQNAGGNGVAIFSSFDSVAVTSTDVLVKYTYFGDANLDGTVDGSDYTLIDNGFLNQATGWYNGDFNYDGAVDGSDYTLIDNAFNVQGPSLAAQIAVATNGSAVPEPATVAISVIAVAGSFASRRRRCN